MCVHAGCEIEKGREDGLMQPVSLEFTVDGVDEKKGVICVGDIDPVKLDGSRFLDYCKQCADQDCFLRHLRLSGSIRPSILGSAKLIRHRKMVWM